MFPYLKFVMSNNYLIRDKVSFYRDALMGFATIGVVLFHFYYWIKPSLIASFFAHYGHWGVDIFLFLSGFGCAFALKKYDSRLFWKKRVIRILPTCLLVGASILLIDSKFGIDNFPEFKWAHIICLHRWYIQASIFCYALSPLFYRILSKYGSKALILLIFIFIIPSIYIPQIGFIKAQLLFPRIPVFLIGMYVGIYDFKLSKKYAISSFLAFGLALVIGLKYLIPVYYWSFLLAFSMPAICFALCYICDIFKKINILKVFEIIGLYSLEVYLIHQYLGWFLRATFTNSILCLSLFIVFLSILAFLTKIIINYLHKMNKKILNVHMSSEYLK